MPLPPLHPNAQRHHYYTATDLCRMLNVSTTTIDAWVASGTLPPPIRPSGPRGKRYWPVEVIDRVIADLFSEPRAS
jgi:DNA-binding transcriptional MerR regulator